MKFDNIIKLVKLGYTETQIKQIEEILDSGNGNTNTNPTPTPIPNPIPTQTPAPAVPAPINTAPIPTPTTAAKTTDAPRAAETEKDADANANKNEPANNPINKEESETVTLLKEMLGLIQKGNINTLSQQSTNNPTDLDGAAVLASIINPKEVTKNG